MAWNETPDGDKNKDPWGKNGNQGPPDLDEIVRKMQKGIGGIFGSKPPKKGDNSIFPFLLAIIFYFGSQLLIFLPIDETITSISISYLKAISIGMFFYILYRLLSSYSEGLTLTIPVFIVVFMGALINIPLDIIFVYGYFGLPEMGGVGCGYATTIVSTLMFIAMLSIVLFSNSYKKFSFVGSLFCFMAV